MNLPVKILLGAIASVLLYGAGIEVAQVPPALKAPPGTTVLSFSQLATVGLPLPLGQAKPGDYLKNLPAGIRQLDQQRVIIQGFMIPTRIENRMVRDFLLVRSQASCCFGIAPQLSDVMEVHMAAKPVESLMDRPVNVIGQLHVQEHWSGPYLGSLYQLDADSVVTNSNQPAVKLTRPPQANGLE